MFTVFVAWTGITIMYCLHVAQQTSRRGTVLYTVWYNIQYGTVCLCIEMLMLRNCEWSVQSTVVEKLKFINFSQ